MKKKGVVGRFLSWLTGPPAVPELLSEESVILLDSMKNDTDWAFHLYRKGCLSYRDGIVVSVKNNRIVVDDDYGQRVKLCFSDHEHSLLVYAFGVLVVRLRTKERRAALRIFEKQGDESD